MKNKETIYNFLGGDFAKLIKERIGRRIKITNGGYFEPKIFSFNKVKKEGEYYFTEDGDDQYFLFAYLKSYKTKKYGMPKYHILDCKTRKEYSNFSFSNRMPVNIASIDEGCIYENVYLKLCQNCKKESNHSILSLIFRSLNWFDVILKIANEKDFSKKDLKKDGYVRLWKQISEAYREKKKNKCEECGIDLNNDRYYLEVHHIDKNRLNNKEENLKSLCVLCHSKKHISNYERGDNLFKINNFKRKY